MLLVLVVLVALVLVLWSLVQSGRLRAGRAVLWMAVAMAATGAWLIVACGVESVDIGFGFVASTGPMPTIFVASRLQIVDAALIWGASMLVAGVVGRHLSQRAARAAD